jgi:acylneuraminate cytidylyltransferase
MKFITVIPARGGSKRFPDKNISPLGGIPLIAHSIRYSLSNKDISGTYVSTDSDAIKKVAENFGAIVLSRSIELSGDFVSTIAVLQDVAEQLQSRIVDFDYIVLLQATNPLRPDSLLNDAIKIIKEGNFDSLMTVNRSDKKLGKIIDNRFCPWNYEFGQRSQDLEPLYYENGLLYISSRELIQNGKIIGDNMFSMIVEHIYGQVDIDTKSDMDYAEYILKNK